MIIRLCTMINECTWWVGWLLVVCNWRCATAHGSTSQTPNWCAWLVEWLCAWRSIVGTEAEQASVVYLTGSAAPPGLGMHMAFVQRWNGPRRLAMHGSDPCTCQNGRARRAGLGRTERWWWDDARADAEAETRSLCSSMNLYFGSL